MSQVDAIDGVKRWLSLLWMKSLSDVPHMPRSCNNVTLCENINHINKLTDSKKWKLWLAIVAPLAFLLALIPIS